ncbi:MAG: hypothetical protein ACT4QF_06970 [Sporichthyaceae bacterium]
MTTHRKPLAQPRRRRLIAVAGASTLTAATLLVGAPQASAATQSISNASFNWGVHDYIQYNGTGASCHFLSAGSLDSTNSTTLAASYKIADGNVTITRTSDALDGTYADRCNGFTGIGASPIGTPANQRINWTGGTGTRDVETGASTVSFVGTASMKYSGQAIRIVDPVLTVDGAGAGTLKATLKVGNTEAAAVSTPNVVIGEFTGVTVNNPAAYSATPSFFGRTVTVAGVTQPTAAVQAAYGETAGVANWGAWTQSWMDAMTGGDGSRFYNSSSTLALTDRFKNPTAIELSYGTLGGISEGQSIGVAVPSIDCGGEVVWVIDGAGGLPLVQDAAVTDRLRFNGALNNITVTDGRVGNGPGCRPSFGLSGSTSEFTATGVPALPASYLGWTPEATGGLTPGALVAPGFPTGTGLSESEPLATSAPDTDATGTAGGDLALEMPTSTPPGDYSGTLTLSLIV